MSRVRVLGYTKEEIQYLHKGPDHEGPVSLDELEALEKMAKDHPGQWTTREALLASGVQRLVRAMKRSDCW